MKKLAPGLMVVFALFAYVLLAGWAPPKRMVVTALDTVLYADNFSQADLGKMPVSLKTNGGGKLVVVDGVEGKWLQMQAQSTYKTVRPINLPARFMVSFDLVAVADEITDLSPVTFGFAVNNSVSRTIMDAYNDGGLCTVSLHYFNKSVLNISSSATKVYANTDFDLTGYTNRSMHVVMKANGDELTVSLDGTQVFDTKVFRNNLGKYFFISAPWEYKNKAVLALGNLVIVKDPAY
jgi:hypothetical protein